MSTTPTFNGKANRVSLESMRIAKVEMDKDDPKSEFIKYTLKSRAGSGDTLFVYENQEEKNEDFGGHLQRWRSAPGPETQMSREDIMVFKEMQEQFLEEYPEVKMQMRVVEKLQKAEKATQAPAFKK